MDVFAALADPVRRDLLRRLALGPARVADLAAAEPVSRPAVSRHLRVLRAAGLAVAQPEGRERHYVLTPDALGPVRDLLAELAVPAGRAADPPFGDAALDGLDLEVRRTVRDHRATPARDEEETG